MYDKILAAATDLPVIIQGAIGSGLFAFIFFLARNTIRLGELLMARVSNDFRATLLIGERNRIRLEFAGSYEERAYLSAKLLRQSLPSTLRALGMLGLGLATSPLHPAFGVAGGIGACFYVAKGLLVFRPIPTTDLNARLMELDLQIAKLGAFVGEKAESTAMGNRVPIMPIDFDLSDWPDTPGSAKSPR